MSGWWEKEKGKEELGYGEIWTGVRGRTGEGVYNDVKRVGVSGGGGEEGRRRDGWKGTGNVANAFRKYLGTAGDDS